MTTIYREYDCLTGQLNLLRPTVTGGVRGDANALKIVFIYTEEDYLADKRPYIIFDIVNTDADPVTDSNGQTHYPLYMFSEDTSPSFDGYTFTVPPEILNKVNGNYVYFQLGFVGLTDDLSDYSFTQSNIENLEFTAANKLIVRDSLSSEISQAPSYYAWADYYRRYGLLSPVQKELTNTGCILKFRTYSGDLNEIELNYVSLDENGNIPSSIYPNVTVRKSRYVVATVSDADKRMFAQTHLTRVYKASDLSSNGKTVIIHTVNADGTNPSNYTASVSYVCYITDRNAINEVVQTNYPNTSIPVYYARVTDANHNPFWYYCDEYGTPVSAVTVEGGAKILIESPYAVKVDVPNDLSEQDIAMLNTAISTIGSTYSKEIMHNDVDDTDTTVYRKSTLLSDNTTSTKYYTTIVETDSVTGTSKTVWYYCDSDGVLETEQYDANTSVPLFEYRTNKIDSWDAYSLTDGMNQYPSARLVKNAVDILGRTDSEVYYGSTRPVQGGAVYVAIENEKNSRLELESDHNALISTFQTLRDDLYGVELNGTRDGGKLSSIYGSIHTLEESTESNTESINTLSSTLNTTVGDVNTTLSNFSRDVLGKWTNTYKSDLLGLQTEFMTNLNQVKTDTELQSTSITSLQSAVCGLTNAISNMTTNINIDFDVYDLVKVKKGEKIDESLIPNLAITDYFGPFSTKASLTSASKVVTRNIEEKVKKTYTGTLSKAMSRKYEDTSFVFYKPTDETMVVGGNELDVIYKVYQVTTAYEYKDTVATQLSDGSISVTGTDSYSDVLGSLVYNVVEDDVNLKVYRASADGISNVLAYTMNKKAYEIGYTSYDVYDANLTYVAVMKFNPVDPLDMTVYSPSNNKVVLLKTKKGKAIHTTPSDSNTPLHLFKSTTPTSYIEVGEMYNEAEHEYVVSYTANSNSYVYDELGNYVYVQTNAVLKLDVEAAKAISPLESTDLEVWFHPDDDSGLSEISKVSAKIYTIDGDGGQLMIVPTTAFVEFGGVYPNSTNNLNANTRQYSDSRINYTTGVQMVNGVAKLYYFFIVVQEGDHYRVVQTDKTVVTGTKSEIVYPQRGDIAVVSGSEVGVDDGTYILGGVDSTGNTYSSVLTHWLKFNCPQAEWGKISTSAGAPPLSAQTDLQTALDSKQPVFAMNKATGGLQIDSTNTLRHNTMNVSGYGQSIGGANSALSIKYDYNGHITEAKTTLIYPPKDLNGDTGIAYWGIKENGSNGNKEGAWIVPDTTISSDGAKAVSGSAVYNFIQGSADVRDEEIANAVNATGVVPYLSNLVTAKTSGKQSTIKTVDITFPEQTSNAWVNTQLEGTSITFPTYTVSNLADVTSESKVFLVFYGNSNWYNMDYKIGVYNVSSKKVKFMRDGNVPMSVSIKGTLFIVN